MKPATFAPAYVAFFLPLTDIARRYGYALAAHGSMQTDMDLVAIPWSDTATSADALATALRNYASGTMSAMFGNALVLSDPEQKPHGRVAYSILIGNAAVIDISIMPRQGAAQ